MSNPLGITGAAEPRDPVHAKATGTTAEVRFVSASAAAFGGVRLCLDVGTPQRGLYVAVTIPLSALMALAVEGATRMEDGARLRDAADRAAAGRRAEAYDSLGLKKRVGS